VAKRRYAEQGACSPGDSVVACDVFLAHGGGHEALRPSLLHRTIAIFLWLADKCREHTHSPLWSQAVYLSRPQFYFDDEPELARTMATSVKLRIAFGEWAGQKVQRVGSGFGDEGERPTLMGPRCAAYFISYP